jgi:hypothetical protein
MSISMGRRYCPVAIQMMCRRPLKGRATPATRPVAGANKADKTNVKRRHHALELELRMLMLDLHLAAGPA